MTKTYEDIFNFLYQKSSLPSKDLSTFWHQAVSPTLKSFHSTDKTGKWCIFLNQSDVDSAWEKVKNCIEKGKIGHKKVDTGLFLAKVSTKLGATNHQNQHVICVYTHDYTNEEEINKTRETLRLLGFTKALQYKRDLETKERKYGTEDEFYLTR